ncbi:hypothetical protein ACLQ25_09670 [Micromonospora sp. DT44]|uniref:hypothetical protein n=1 Tax=Micromonospora sp. DT44 TaxID=3393439 RepID=UPI003CEC8ECB
MSTALIIWAIASLGCCALLALLLLIDALLEVRMQGRRLTDTCQELTAQAALNPDAEVFLTVEQQAMVSDFRTWLDYASAADFDREDLR